MTLETSAMVQVGLQQHVHQWVVLTTLYNRRSLYEAEAYAHGAQHGGELRLVQQNGHCGKYALVIWIWIRIWIAHSLLKKPVRASAFQMTRFHSDEYINFLQRVTPDNLEHLAVQHGGLEQGIARCKGTGLCYHLLVGLT